MEKILCRHEVTGHETELPADSLPAWRALGWKPVSEYPPPTPPASPDLIDAGGVLPVPTAKPAARKRANENEE